MSGWQETCVRVCSRAIDRSASATSRRSWRPSATSSTRRTLSWLVIVICFVFRTPAAYLPSQLLNLTLDAIARFKGFIEISTRRGRIVTTSFLLHSLTRLPVLSDTLCQTHTHTHTRSLSHLPRGRSTPRTRSTIRRGTSMSAAAATSYKWISSP